MAIFVFKFSDDFRGAYAEKLPTKLQQKEIVDNFCMGLQYDQLEGKEGGLLSARKMNFEKPSAGGEAHG